MTIRDSVQIVPAQAISEGAGVRVRRTIGTPALRNLDPFLMLDFFGSENPNDYIAGFPDHPHRGFITFTYMLHGHMLHRDSMGNTGDLKAGGAQWMKAASGVIHSEIPQQKEGLMSGFQLWINLPAKEKMSAPEYQEFTPNAIPEIERDGAKIRVLCGNFENQLGAIQDPNTDTTYLDVFLPQGKNFIHQIPAIQTCFIYIFEGNLVLNEKNLPQHSLVVLGAGDAVALKAGEKNSRFILVAGKPLKEPIVQYGPFVMNTRAEIEQAFQDYQTGKLVQKKASVSGR